MFFRLLLLFTTIPLIELALLIRVERQVGLTSTISLVLLTGALGAWLAKTQGVQAVARLKTEMAAGRMPTEPLLDGLMIFIAGAVLLTPGLLTDLFGFFLLTPFGRKAIRRRVSERWLKKMTFDIDGEKRSAVNANVTVTYEAKSESHGRSGAVAKEDGVILVQPDDSGGSG